MSKSSIVSDSQTRQATVVNCALQTIAGLVIFGDMVFFVLDTPVIVEIGRTSKQLVNILREYHLRHTGFEQSNCDLVEYYGRKVYLERYFTDIGV